MNIPKHLDDLRKRFFHWHCNDVNANAFVEWAVDYLSQHPNETNANIILLAGITHIKNESDDALRYVKEILKDHLPLTKDNEEFYAGKYFIELYQKYKNKESDKDTLEAQLWKLTSKINYPEWLTNIAQKCEYSETLPHLKDIFENEIVILAKLWETSETREEFYKNYQAKSSQFQKLTKSSSKNSLAQLKKLFVLLNWRETDVINIINWAVDHLLKNPNETNKNIILLAGLTCSDIQDIHHYTQKILKDFLPISKETEEWIAGQYFTDLHKDYKYQKITKDYLQDKLCKLNTLLDYPDWLLEVSHKCEYSFFYDEFKMPFENEFSILANLWQNAKNANDFHKMYEDIKSDLPKVKMPKASLRARLKVKWHLFVNSFKNK